MFRSAADNFSREDYEYILHMAYIAEMKEWDNRPHLERIRRFCFAMASGLGMSHPDVDVFVNASLLHDVGKVMLPDDLLRKTGHFDQMEWKIVEAHTTHGADILAGSSSPVLQAAEIIAYTHHERWDGSGYPRGLKGEKIPMTGRIVALADVFDALTTRRTYKEPVDYEKGLEIIQGASGSLFDPQLVRIFSDKFNDILRALPDEIL